MPNFAVQCTIPYFTGIPEDVCTNVLHFSRESAPISTNWDDLATNVTDFYEFVYVGGSSGIAMANYAVPSGFRLTAYDLGDPIPRAPVFEATPGLAGFTPVATTLPPESSVCLSFQGNKISGEPQARRRGRMYLGCIGTAWDSSSSSSFPKVNTTRMSHLATACQNLVGDSTDDGWTWTVYSRTDSAGVAITNGWIDDAPDTQRRRGNNATQRVTWVA